VYKRSPLNNETGITLTVVLFQHAAHRRYLRRMKQTYIVVELLIPFIHCMNRSQIKWIPLDNSFLLRKMPYLKGFW